MTQILNVPMPADEAIKIIIKIFESNRMVDIVVSSWPRMLRLESIGDMYNECWESYFYQSATIISVIPIIPTYSIWDKVMILDGGFEWVVKKVNHKPLPNKVYVTVYNDFNDWTDSAFYHRSEICKIA